MDEHLTAATSYLLLAVQAAITSGNWPAVHAITDALSLLEHVS